MSSSHPSKRRKVFADEAKLRMSRDSEAPRSSLPGSLARSISPPAPSRDRSSTKEQTEPPKLPASPFPSPKAAWTIVRSPFQLTQIRDLNAENNVDTVSIRDIVCDPMIKEIWCFNYLFDPGWIISNLDPDTRPTTNVILIHGSWQAESENRKRILDACARHANISQVTAYLPDRFGTHHSKMMVLFRHDDTAEVVIHTANMIEQDWRKMTQGVWKTGLLPKGGERGDAEAQFGSGQRMKYDLITYLDNYTDRSGGLKFSRLTKQLKEYDFDNVRGALVASVPRRYRPLAVKPTTALWGWPSLQRVLRNVPVQNRVSEADPKFKGPEVIVQISSIATLGPSAYWLEGTLFKTLLESSLSHSPQSSEEKSENPASMQDRDSTLSSKLSVVYPTPATIRQSLDGYASGTSIHMKLDSEIAKKQVSYLRSHLHDWAWPSTSTPAVHHNAGRSLAAPHIKTYMRYATRPSSTKDSPIYIDWALLTSANLSTQAWGGSQRTDGTVWVQSYEIGVLVWPSLYHGGANEEDAKMVAVFGKDMPDETSYLNVGDCTVVGLRVPYSLPLHHYAADEQPWSPTKEGGYVDPDRFGRIWDA